MHIEFLGIMGSGKTTICSYLNHLWCKKLGYFPGPLTSYLSISTDPTLYLEPFLIRHLLKRNYHRLGKLLFDPNKALLSYLDNNKAFVSRIFSLIDTNDIKNNYQSEELRYFLALITFYQQHAICNKRGVFLIDEGFYSSLRHFLIDENNAVNLSNQDLLKHIPKVDVLIHCEISPEESYKRLLKRAAGVPKYLKQFEMSERMDVLHRIHLKNKSLIELCRNNKVKVITVDSGNDLKNISDQITSEINI